MSRRAGRIAIGIGRREDFLQLAEFVLLVELLDLLLSNGWCRPSHCSYRENAKQFGPNGFHDLNTLFQELAWELV
jgi:hypothetical protein